MHKLQYTCTSEDYGKKLKWILKSQLVLSEAFIKSLKWKDAGILVNGVKTNVDYLVQLGDIIQVNIEDTKPLSSNLIVNDVPLDILYEDEELLIINKPAGITVHANSSKSGVVTIAGMVANYLGNTAFHAVNRLDKGVTGIMVIAKTGYMHARLMKLLHTTGFQREYLAICESTPYPSFGTIDEPIGREEDSIIKRKISKDGDPSKTLYQVLSSNDTYSLVHLKPITGRTHQLRLHMSSIGHPLVGDWLYGTENPSIIHRPALHSYALQLHHPITNKEIHLACPLPEDMQQFFPNWETTLHSEDTSWI